jgi:hypothetical protein
LFINKKIAMKQMDISDDVKIVVDYEDTDLPYTVKELQPTLWIDGNSYCCVLGPNPKQGVFGCGITPVAALLNWDDHLRERIKKGNPADQVVQYAIDVLKATKYEIN